MKKPLRFLGRRNCGPMDNGKCLERHSQRLLRRQNDSCFGRLFRRRRLRHLRAGGSAAYRETHPRKSLSGRRQHGRGGESDRCELHV